PLTRTASSMRSDLSRWERWGPWSHVAGCSPWLAPIRPTRFGYRSIRGLGDDADLGGQRAVHRALVCDLHQPLALVGVERAFHGDHAIDLVQHALLRLALLAVLCVDLAVLQRDGDAIERQRLAIGIEPHGHGGAGP